MSLVLPRSTVATINSVPHNQRHPGLQLDKFSVPGDQVAQKAALASVCNNSGDSALLTALLERRKAELGKLPDLVCFSCTTSGPLTLHLARASALENAGICLHALYGFTYLPGSGLKGMARAYAETLWLPAEANKQQAWRQIEEVFGWVPGSDKGKGWKPEGVPKRERHDNARVGGIVFHDAWPESWPQLIVDIVNNHHPYYYQASPDDNDHPPGDWENPVPVYFLAVKAGTTFTFALSKRRSDTAADLLDLTQTWLLGALCHLGAGAKTAAGYGAFKSANSVAPAPSPQARTVFEATLELVTPAFLAGASQQAEDCDLRPATLRGHLRWWWRTMHAGFVDVKTLRALEAVIWGDTHSGGAVRIEISRQGSVRASLYSHPEDRQSGIRYAGYGMDERSKGERRQRFIAAAGATWKLRVLSRKAEYRTVSAHSEIRREPITLTADQINKQALAALWLLVRFGGVGSKARKGFGSLSTTAEDSLDLARCRSIAHDLRECIGENVTFRTGLADSPSIADPELQLVELSATSTDAFEMIDRIGRAYAAVASRFKHNRDGQQEVQAPNKAAWGLPRKIHGPMPEPLRHQSAETHQRPEWLDFPKRPRDVRPDNARHASPIHLHVGKSPSGEFVLRLIAMPAVHLPNRATNVEMLKAFAGAFEQEFRSHTAQQDRRGSGQMVRPAPAALSSGEFVEVTILERMEKSGPNAYRVQEFNQPPGMLVHGTPPNPLPGIGEKVRVYREASTNPRSPMYRWTPPVQQQPQGGKGGHGGRPRGRR